MATKSHRDLIKGWCDGSIWVLSFFLLWWSDASMFFTYFQIKKTNICASWGWVLLILRHVYLPAVVWYGDWAGEGEDAPTPQPSSRGPWLAGPQDIVGGPQDNCLKYIGGDVLFVFCRYQISPPLAGFLPHRTLECPLRKLGYFLICVKCLAQKFRCHLKCQGSSAAGR